jgi:glycine betaine/proline transport system substrate-binding protein
LIACITATGLLGISGCSTVLKTDELPAAGSRGTVTIGVYPWAGYDATLAVVSTILETKLGYKVVRKKTTAKESWPQLESGKIDVVLENWGHAPWKQKYVDDGTVLPSGSTGNKGVTGWYIPMWMAQEYPDILDWRNLDKYAELFATKDTGGKGRLLDGDPSYATNDEALVRNLDLNYTVQFSGSEQATVDEALAASRDRTPLLFYFWQPHWLFQKYRFAKINLPEYTTGCDADPATITCDYPVDDLDKFVSKSFAARGEEAAKFISTFSWTNADQNEVADYLVNEKLSPRAAAEKWMESHPDDWEAWLAS